MPPLLPLTLTKSEAKRSPWKSVALAMRMETPTTVLVAVALAVAAETVRAATAVEASSVMDAVVSLLVVVAETLAPRVVTRPRLPKFLQSDR